MTGPGPIELDSEPWAMRTEPCACGVDILAADNPGMIQAAVEAHNATSVHQEWRAVHALQRPTRRKCPCHEGAA